MPEPNTCQCLTKSVLSADARPLSGLCSVADYHSVSPEFNKEKIESADTSMRSLQDAEHQAYAAHFGESSTQYQTLGRKKKSEYNPGGRCKPTTPQ